MLRALQLLRTRYLEPRPGSSPRRWPRSRRPASAAPSAPLLSGRRLAYAGAVARWPPRPRRPPPCSSPAPAAARSPCATRRPAERSRRHAARSDPRCYPGNAAPAPGARRAVAQLAEHPVSKTGGWGFESLLPCSVPVRPTRRSVNRQTKRQMAKQGADRPRARPSAGPPPQTTRAGAHVAAEFFSEVRGELRKVAWPTAPRSSTRRSSCSSP